LLIDTGSEDLRVFGDFDRLAQVVSNLLSNAAKYMDAGGEARIALTREGAEAVLRVADSGVGIPAGDLSRVFEMFSQVRAHQARAAGGLGIGLSLVRSLVELHGGRIEARSAGSGLGSEFIVRLPLYTPDVSHPATAQAAAGRDVEAPRRILVVDDNVDAATSLAMLLSMRGHDVVTAHDGLEAIRCAQKFSPDIVMLDLGMPHMDGVETARRLRTLPGGDTLQIIALTGWGQDADRIRTSEAGFDAHLVKPADPEALQAVLANGLRSG
jgi:CheY-like chemotaxis protein